MTEAGRLCLLNLQHFCVVTPVNTYRHTFICNSVSMNVLTYILFHGVAQREAMSYYTELEAKLREDYKKEKDKVSTKPLDMAFVTFQNETMTAL